MGATGSVAALVCPGALGAGPFRREEAALGSEKSSRVDILFS